MYTLKIYIKNYIILLSILIGGIGIIFWLGDKEFYIRDSKFNIINDTRENNVGDITTSIDVIQRFRNDIYDIQSIEIPVWDYGASIKGNLNITLKDVTRGQVIANKIVSSVYIQKEKKVVIKVKNGKKLQGGIIEIKISSDTGIPHSAATVFYSKTKSLKDIKNQEFSINGKIVDGFLCLKTIGYDKIWISNYYGEIIWGIILLLSLYYWKVVISHKNGKRERLLVMYVIWKKYKFLIKQLIGRDFKIRYKNSILGMLWSVLNPLLIAFIQYMVFSQVFRSDIKNFPVYLLSGTIVFNFFNEAVGLALGAIIGNASLITKVYVPKYIYPITRVLSSTINLLISLIPLVMIVMITGEKITKAFLLLPFFLLTLILFTLGIGLGLSALMVFFRDVQFLWGVLSLMWMYLTPLFYPANILPEQFKWVLKYNPMYYFIQGVRTIVLGGVSPEPKIYAYCFIAGTASLLIGGWYFKNKQDRFIFYI